MSYEELMIGDYVEIGNSGYWKVTLATLRLAYEEPDRVKPILLTPEILEINGWYFDEIGESFSDNHLTIYGKKAPFCVFSGQEITYVHELQHALKFDKIQKEIKIDT